jgi:hypothetical protein
MSTNAIPFFRLTGHMSRDAQYLDPGETSPHSWSLYVETRLVPLSLNMPAIPHLA